MSEKKIHMYCFPGMAANTSIFEFLKLPDHYILHLIAWELPNENESLQVYARRISRHIEHKDAVLLGVSFGGILVQEIAKFYSARKLIIVSSVKTKFEFPKRIEFLKTTKLNKLFPVFLIEKVSSWEQFIFIPHLKKVGKLYDKYLTVKDRKYLKWSLSQIINWDQINELDNLIHIQGELDVVFPVKNIKKCHIVPKGTHAMIVNRAKWFNENLPLLIEN